MNTTPGAEMPTQEQICDLLQIGNPSEEECRLIHLGYAAALNAAAPTIKDCLMVPDGAAAPAAPAEGIRNNAEKVKPMFWVRLCSDGGYEGPLHDDRIEHVRKLSGAWHPLYLGAAPQAQQPGAALPTSVREALSFYADSIEHYITFNPAEREQQLKFHRDSPDWKECGEDSRGHERFIVTSDKACAALHDLDEWVDHVNSASAEAQAQQPGAAKVAPIKQLYTLAEIEARIASGDYSAELLLQHAMLLLLASSKAADTQSSAAPQAPAGEGGAA